MLILWTSFHPSELILLSPFLPEKITHNNSKILFYEVFLKNNPFVTLIQKINRFTNSKLMNFIACWFVKIINWTGSFFFSFDFTPPRVGKRSRQILLHGSWSAFQGSSGSSLRRTFARNFDRGMSREKKMYLDFDSRFKWRPTGGRISSLSSLDSAQNFLQGFLHGEVLILLSGSLQQKRFWKMAVVSPPREVFITAIRLADKVCSEKTWRRIVLFMSALDCLLAWPSGDHATRVNRKSWKYPALYGCQ